MMNLTYKTEEKIRELLSVLDIDIGHIQENLIKLNDLRSFVIKRDDTALKKMLEDIQSQSGGYKENEMRRKMLREELAEMLGCGIENVKLTSLEKLLSGDLQMEVSERKTKLKSLSQKLRIEHLSTSRLLSDCARFNGMLLKSILELGQAKTITYNTKGCAERQSNCAFMNIQF